MTRMYLTPMLTLLMVPLIAIAEPIDCVVSPNATVELGSHHDGILEELLVNRGDRVKIGQPLVRLDSEMEVMNAELARIRADSDIAVRSSQIQEKFRAREHNRLSSLRDNQSVSASVYEQAEIEHSLAKLSMDTATLEHNIAKMEYERTRTQLERRTIKSPVDGLVVAVEMSPGEYVHEQSTLMIIAATDPLHVEVYLPVTSYGTIREGMAATVRPEQPIGGEYPATVAVVDQVFDAASRTFGVRLELSNPEFELPGGLRCMVEFEASVEPEPIVSEPPLQN
ncbi:MAG: efflux RND transporter periplasmic adaptor subunit [Halioglobus sp.]